MMILSIAWRNVWRNSTRSGVVIAAIAIGLWAGIFTDSFMEGMASQFVYTSIHTETGHIQIHHPGFLLNYDMQDSIARSDNICVGVRRIPSVAGASQDFQMFALASTASASAGLMMNGIEPNDEKSASDLYKNIVSGSYFGGTRQNQIVIGQKLADKLHANVNSKIILTLQTVAGEINYDAFKVCGIYRTYNSDYDGSNVFVLHEDLSRIVGFAPTTSTSIKILMKKDDDAEPVAAALQRQYPSLTVQPYSTLSPMLIVMSGWMQDIALAFVIIILIALAFGIVNTMLMAVLDRTRELGMLMAVGMNPRQVFRMVVLETVFLAFTGAVIGVALAIGTVAYFGKMGIDLSIISEGLSTFGYSTMVYPTLSAAFYVQIAILVFIIAVAASIFPARRATHLIPVEALREQ